MNAFAALKSAFTGVMPKLSGSLCGSPPIELTAVPHILVVDDNEDYCALLRAWLESDGYEVEVAHDIATARAKTESNGFDLVLLDLKFPDGESGVDYLIWAHQHHPDLGIIVCSGEPGYLASHVNELVAVGAITLMYKPLKREQLLRVVNRFLTYGLMA